MKKILNKILINSSLLLFFSNTIIFDSLGFRKTEEHGIQEQALFSGFYVQGNDHNTDTPQLSPPGNSILRFNIENRNYTFLSANLQNNNLYEQKLYSEDFLNYTYEELDYSIYTDSYNNFKPSVEVGPKESQICSTCKIRAYYYNVQSFFGRVAVMYDFTGFLVGESLLLTAAHGLYLDVTSGIFDDGIQNYYFPGKIEIYGAIGLTDVWGSEYPYYALAKEIFLDSEFITTRAINADWALLRLDKPLGKELSYRVLIPESENFDSLKIIGYPSWNQSFEKVDASNSVILSNYGQFRYDSNTQEGMSGSPICSLYEDEYIDSYVDRSRSISSLLSRCAIGMHISYDYENHYGFGLRFSYTLTELVELLNKRYRPESINLLNEITHASSAHNNFLSEDYFYNIDFSNTTIGSDSIFFGDSALITLSFNFPIKSVVLNFDNTSPISNEKKIYYELNNNQIESSIGNTYSHILFQEPIFSFTIHSSFSSQLNLFSVIPNWNYIPYESYFPNYNNSEISIGSNNNCVSYALNNLLGNIQYNENNSLGLTANIFRPYGITPYSVFNAFETKLDSLNRSIRIIPIKKFDKCTHGGYKICILTDNFNYYHFLRQNSNGDWSHFIINTGVSNLDSLGNIIVDPENSIICNFSNERIYIESLGRNYYDVSFNLTTLVGYYEVY
ncbi:MAG: hypothetical protein MJZ37_04000 [Bacilli bacterium]|nr:hypothetical protein [Bacilli bacterium]